MWKFKVLTIQMTIAQNALLEHTTLKLSKPLVNTARKTRFLTQLEQLSAIHALQPTTQQQVHTLAQYEPVYTAFNFFFICKLVRLLITSRTTHLAC